MSFNVIVIKKTSRDLERLVVKTFFINCFNEIGWLPELNRIASKELVMD